MTEQPAPAVLVERRKYVELITINRPQARNAVTGEVSMAVGDALEVAQRDPDVRAVVITGAGNESCCAGVDLKALTKGENVFHRDHPEWSFAGYARHFIAKPTIAAVNGTALGGGCELALASDLVIASVNASFGLPEVKRGLLAGAGGMFRLLDQVPRKVALELLFTGDAISAEEAHRMGLINQVVPEGTVVEAALRLAERIAVNAPLSVRASKRVAYGAEHSVIVSEEPKWDLSAREFAVLFGSEDAKEGPRAFAEKRQPVWQAR